MASMAEHPLKKRRIYDSFSSDSASLPPHQQSIASLQPHPPPPPSQEEILRKRRNREEIRSLYECYRRMKHCISKKDSTLLPDLKKAYLALIDASRGCTSVQRILAELVPRYASYCPTALEAATKVSINMYNWSLAIIIRGEDTDDVAYQTAKACIFGLVDICCTAAFEAPTSSITWGICSAVFLNVLTFFISSFEGKDIYVIGGKEVKKLEEPIECFYDLKQEPADDGESALDRLFRLRALSLLRIFFSFPRMLLEACFELLVSDGAGDNLTRGQYFLTQVAAHLNTVEHALGRPKNKASECTDSALPSTDFEEKSEVKHVPEENSMRETPLLLSKNCIIAMAIERDLSLRGWLLSKLKKLSESPISNTASDRTSFLGDIYGFLLEMERGVECVGHEGDSHDQSKSTNQKFSVSNIAVQCGSAAEISLRDKISGAPDASSTDQPIPRFLATGNSENSYGDKNSGKKHLMSNQCLSSLAVKLLDPEKGGAQNHECVKSQTPNIVCRLPLTISVSGGTPSTSVSSKQNSATKYYLSPNLVNEVSDGDPAAMDVFSASKLLWLGSLGHDASEGLVRLQFEDFGPVVQFSFFPAEDFALIEYRNIMDAVKAREYMQGSSLWGGCLHIKFLDTGFGSRGAGNGGAINESCHVYIGKVASKWDKDDIFNELMAAGLKNPRLITDLSSERALLLEFGTAEEAAIAITHIRRHRKDTGCHHALSYPDKPDMATQELVSPRVKMEKFDSQVHNRPAQLNWTASSSVEVIQFSPACSEAAGTSYASERTWQYKMHEHVPPISAPGRPPCPSFVTHGGSIIPPPVPAYSFVRPAYPTESNSWVNYTQSPSLQLHQISPGMTSIDNRQANVRPVLPFIPCSITPLSQLSGSSVQKHDQKIPNFPVPSPPPLPPLDLPPPLLSSPPPLPLSQPPSIPPPPCSPPPVNLPALGTSSLRTGEPCLLHQWQGALSKSGIQYCLIHAVREESSICKYTVPVSEPADWPARLDVTKRTDIRHVKATFTNTPPHKREVCRLLPSTTSDKKGFMDFINYLRQRDCAGVIKIPAIKSMWARLLFILPHSQETCSLLSIAPHPAECLLALVLSKDTNFEFV